MGSFSGLGIGLSFVFGCILMGLVAEFYYLLWWKKRITNTSNTRREITEFSVLFCWGRPISSFNSTSSSQELVHHHSQQQDLELGSRSKGYGIEEGGIETELMRAHNLCTSPRFLFTIKEENKEDLESEDGKSTRKGSRTKSLSEIIYSVDGIGTPFLTPLSSPSTVKTTSHNFDSYNLNGFNPLFESITESELNRLRSSPPPKFKFLKDAEDKLIKRMFIEEAERKRALKSEDSVQEEKGASFVKLVNGKSLVRDQLIHNQASQPTNSLQDYKGAECKTSNLRDAVANVLEHKLQFKPISITAQYRNCRLQIIEPDNTLLSHNPKKPKLRFPSSLL